VSTRLLLRLFPGPWQERYSQEFAALLEDVGLSAPTLLDVLLAALDARLHPSDPGRRSSSMADRLRHLELVIFVCWVIVAVAAAGFVKLTEDPPLNPLYLNIAVPDLAHDIMYVGGLVSLAGVLLAGVPIGAAICLDAIRRRRWSQLALLGTPFLAALAWFGITAAIRAIPFSVADDVPKTLMLLVWVGSGFLAVAVSCVALALAARNSEVDARTYRRAVTPAHLAVAGMVGMAVALIAWGVALFVADPYDFFGFSGLLATSTALSWLVIAASAAGATLVALRAARRIALEA